MKWKWNRIKGKRGKVTSEEGKNVSINQSIKALIINGFRTRGEKKWETRSTKNGTRVFGVMISPYHTTRTIHAPVINNMAMYIPEFRTIVCFNSTHGPCVLDSFVELPQNILIPRKNRLTATNICQIRPLQNSAINGMLLTSRHRKIQTDSSSRAEEEMKWEGSREVLEASFSVEALFVSWMAFARSFEEGMVSCNR